MALARPQGEPQQQQADPNAVQILRYESDNSGLGSYRFAWVRERRVCWNFELILPFFLSLTSPVMRPAMAHLVRNRLSWRMRERRTQLWKCEAVTLGLLRMANLTRWLMWPMRMDIALRPATFQRLLKTHPKLLSFISLVNCENTVFIPDYHIDFFS